MMHQFAIMGLQALASHLRKQLCEETGKTSEALFDDAEKAHNAMFEAGIKVLKDLGYSAKDVDTVPGVVGGGIAGSAGMMLSLLYVTHAGTVFAAHVPIDGKQDGPSGVLGGLSDLLGGLDENDSLPN